MPFIPHTEDDVREMLDAIGVRDIETLFDEIPPELRGASLRKLPRALPEMEIGRLMRDRAREDVVGPCFIGAGAYRHHIPAAVWEIATRGEFYSAYTPYQAEASQGTLQLLYEYQTMMSELMAMDVSNASLYDGASALAEAILMAVRANRAVRSGRILIAGTVHPVYRQVVHSIVGNQEIRLETLDSRIVDGVLDPGSLTGLDDATAVVVPQPNWFGRLEQVDALTDQAHAAGALVIALVNPTAMALLRPPGQWGRRGADIVCGEGQPLGVPVSSGGPYFGFMCCRRDYMRQMPGRIVGRTIDMEGQEGFTLTLQAREQHIRRSKATSNICTNQGLMVTGATIYMSLLGAEGLRRVASHCHANTRLLCDKLCSLPGVRPLHEGPFFHERALSFGQPAEALLEKLAEQGILGGYPLGRHDRAWEDSVLICATELVTEADIERYVHVLGDLLEDQAA